MNLNLKNIKKNISQENNLMKEDKVILGLKLRSYGKFNENLLKSLIQSI